LTIQYLSNTFDGGTVPLGNASWRHNLFKGCRLIVDAMPTEFVGNSIQQCQIGFVPGGITPTQFADWLEPKEPGLAAHLRAWAARGGYTPSSLN
jgi:hypothetical protein